MLSRLVFSLAFSAAFLSLASAAEWTYVGGDGKTITLEQPPTRIIAHANAAAGLIPYGIRPVGIYVDTPVAEDKSLAGLDLTGIEIIGEAWGEIDVEKAAALKPDLIIAEYWPLEKAWSGFEDTANDASRPVLNLAPITGVEQGPSIVGMIEDYEALAVSLGADVSAADVAQHKAAFDSAMAAFKSAVAAKPNLTVLPVWAGTDALYVAATAGSAELSDFASWGLKLITPEVADDRGYWETLSWENADKYQPDLIIVDNRSDATMGTATAQPMWTAMKAAASGQVAEWPAFWLRNYGAYAAELDKLTAAITAADENLTD